jgi:glycosyltransferase involved in cell wall biosynthesis
MTNINTSCCERPLLTIAIPTYNRARLLPLLLSALADQLRQEPRVELIVIDNASPDDTGDVIRDFQSRGLAVRYLRNDSNIGGDANFVRCFEEARGSYVWIFGDDDAVLPGALKKILGYICEQEYDLVHLTSYLFREDYLKEKRGWFQAAAPEVFTDAKELAKRLHINFTFISGTIVNKARLMAVPHRPFSELVGSNLVQLGWVFAALKNHRRSLLVHERLVAARTGNTGGYALCRVFGRNLQYVLGTWLDTLPDTAVIISNGTLQKFLPAAILRHVRNDDSFTQEDPAEVLQPLFGSNWRYWFFVFPMLKTPMPLANLWLQVVRAVNLLDRFCGFPLIGHVSPRARESLSRPRPPLVEGH